jgi:hypothetical protein
MQAIKKLSLFPLSFILLFATSSTAQQTTNHELGLRMGGLTDFDFIYKKQTGENRYLRYQIGNVQIQYENSDILREYPDFGEVEEISRSSVNSSIGFGLGFEKRRSIRDKLMLIHGWIPSVSLDFSQDTENGEKVDQRFIAGLGIGYILGFQMPLSDRFQISIETIPSLFVEYENLEYERAGPTNQDDVNADLGFNANFVSLSVMYRFSTE